MATQMKMYLHELEQDVTLVQILSKTCDYGGSHL